MIELDESPEVVTAGASLFADALIAQVTTPRQLQWAPPVPGSEADLAAIGADPRTHSATAESVRRLTTASPQWVDVVPAREALGLGPREFLHAGPPVEWADASGPVRGALAGAMMYEGLADSFEQAARIAAEGGVCLAPCHSRAAVGPMAGVVSASMPVSVIEDAEHGGRAYCTLNEGLGKVLRYGAYSPSVIARLRWLERVLGPLFGNDLAPARACRRPQHHRSSPADGRRVSQPQPRRRRRCCCARSPPTCLKAAREARTSSTPSASSTETTISS